MNKRISQPRQLFTARDVATLLDLPLSRVARAIRRDVIPDFQTRAVKLFLPSRLPRIAKQIAGSKHAN
jgi:hypothetical protein